MSTCVNCVNADSSGLYRNGKPSVEFSWESNDEMDPAQGRGWAVSNGGEIEGMIVFHQGDESAFKANRKKGK